MIFQNNQTSQQLSQQPVAPNQMNTIYNMFGGAQNLQAQVNNLQMSIPNGMTYEGYANQLVQSGQLSKEKLDWAMQTANSLFGRR